MAHFCQSLIIRALTKGIKNGTTNSANDGGYYNNETRSASRRKDTVVRDIEFRMKVVDELSLWRAVRLVGSALKVVDDDGKELTPRSVISSLGCAVHPKRAHRWLEKWADRGLYEYGVCLDLGWLTEEGKRLDDPRKWQLGKDARGGK